MLQMYVICIYNNVPGLRFDPIDLLFGTYLYCNFFILYISRIVLYSNAVWDREWRLLIKTYVTEYVHDRSQYF